MQEPRVLIVDDAGCTGLWRDVHFEVWTRPADADAIQLRFDGQRQLLASLPEERKIVAFSVVHDAAIRAIDSDGRELFRRKVDEAAPRVKGSVVVIQSVGFKAAALRSITAAMTLLSRVSYPTKTEGDLEAALRWAAPLLEPGDDGRPISERELRAAYESLLAHAADRAGTSERAAAD